jgi:predicted AlkP superfamily pyrophosphatase or phosphodiesterase
MKKNAYLLLLLFFLCVLSNSIVAQTKPQVKKTLFIIVDGIARDMLKKAQTPYLDSISVCGTFTPAFVGGEKGTYSQTPTISAVGYNSLLTGTWVNKHNVWDNDIKDPNYSYPTVFRLLKDKYPNKKIAVYSSWQDNRTKLIGEAKNETNNIKMDYSCDGFELDTINFPHDNERIFMKNIDEKVAVEAAKCVRENAPDLSWVYLEFTDDMGHMYGDGKQMEDAINFEDALIGKIWNAIKDREKNNNEKWLLVITTDHGRSPVDGKGHGGQSDRERGTWIVTNYKDVNSSLKKSTPGIVSILPSIVNFMDIDVPKDVKYEWDGVPFIGTADFSDFKSEEHDGKFCFTWKNLSGNKKQTADILVSYTNHFKKNEPDKYQKIATVKLSDEKMILSKDLRESGFYKFVLDTPNQTLNYWVVKDNK